MFCTSFCATVCKTVRPMLSDCSLYCLSVLSVLSAACLPVTLVYCGQTVGWIKMQLGMEVGLSPGHIVLNGDSAPSHKTGTTPNFGPCMLWPNCWMHQDATWYAGRPRPRRHCVIWGPSSPSPKAAQPHCLAHVRCGQTAGVDGLRCHLVWS